MTQTENQSFPGPRPSFAVWALHWVSALLVLFLLVTSLSSGLGFTKRLLPAMWMDWHLSAGVVLLAVTAVRIWTSRPWSLLPRHAIKPVLFFGILLVLLSGPLIYQKPPFGRAGELFGLFSMPTFVRLNHSLHGVIIDLHITFSFGIAVLIIAHVASGLRRSGAFGRSPIAVMLWPWR